MSSAVGSSPTMAPMADAAAALPMDRFPLPWTTARNRQLQVAYPASLAERVTEVARGASLLVFAVLLAAVKITLRGHGGSDRIMVGRSAGGAGSPLIATSDALHLTMTFRQVLNATRDQLLRDADGSNAADVNSDDAHAVTVAVSCDGVSEEAIPEGPPIVLRFRCRNATLSVHVEYCDLIYDCATIERLVHHLGAVAQRGLAAPDCELEQLLAADESLARTGWSQADEREQPEPIHRLVKRQAELHPDVPALVFQGRTMTYAALDRAANRMAVDLRSAGAGRGDRIGIVATCRPSFAVAMLGALRVGAACLPVDPAAPIQRSEAMLSGARAVITDDPDIGRFVAAPLIPVADVWRDCDAPDEVCFESDVDDAAYIIFTSGSSGAPKGVVVPHRGLSRLALNAHGDSLGLSVGTRVLQFASPAVDAMVWDLLCPLAVGATVCLAPPEELLPGLPLQQTLRRVAANVITLPPSSLAMLDPEAVPPTLHTVVVAGEPCPRDIARRWARRVRLINAYGPTETTICATLTRIDGTESRPPIGSSVSHVRTYVLNRSLMPVAPGVVGELFVGGAAAARGYLDAPAATARSFIPDPFASLGGQRLYRTGDLVRQRTDGRLDFIGRRDHQVKVRGFRVELEEIEACLREHPAVADAVVAPDGDGAETQLIAYVIPAGEFGTEDVRQFAALRLPGHMVPAWVVVIEQLPRTNSGKVDRRRLPDWRELAAPPRGGRALWSGPVEEIVASAWHEVLGAEPPDADTDFFRIGGQSLTAIRTVSMINAWLGVSLPSSAIFELRTVRKLARRVIATRSDVVRREPIARADSAAPAPLSLQQQRLWFQQQLDPDSAAYNIAGAVALRGPVHVSALRQSLEIIVARHSVLRSRFPIADGVPLQQALNPPPAILSVIDMTCHGVGAREVAMRLALETARTPFTLEATAGVRLLLLRIAPDTHLFAMVVHHIVFDTASLDLFAAELRACYRALVAGMAPALHPLPVQYSDYARWQRSDEEATLAAGTQYWRRQLQGLLEAELPTDHPRLSTPSFAGAICDATVDADVAGRIGAVAAASGATLHMACIAVVAGLLSHYTGASDIGVGTAVANRDRPEVERLIGFFLNVIVVRTRVAPSATVRDLLQQVREAALAGYAHADVPFDRVVASLPRARTGARQPLFNVTVNMTDAAPAWLSLEGLDARPVDLGHITAKFDLEFLLSRSPEGLGCRLVYSHDLFDAGTAALIMHDFIAWLRALASTPDALLSTLPVSAPVRRITHR